MLFPRGTAAVIAELHAYGFNKPATGHDPGRYAEAQMILHRMRKPEDLLGLIVPSADYRPG